MNQYRATPSVTQPQIVLGFGNATDREIQTGLTALAEILR
jgi:DNA-binding transcriptional MocR family regulator